MTFNTIITIVLVLIALAIIGAGTYVYLRNRTLEEIRADVYQLFLRADYIYIESKSGKQKMKYVVQRARSMLPSWLQMFITDDLLYEVLEIWFRAVKDLLDDGKYNKTI